MGNKVLQKGFGAGEISSSLFSRSDLEQYKMGATKIQNFIVLPQGAIRTRAGFRFVGEAIDSTKAVRLIPFRYSSDQTFILEFGDKTLRIISDGGYVSDNSGAIYQVESPFKAEDLQNVDYAQNADILTLCNPDYKPYELRRYSNTDWRFVDVRMEPTLESPKNISYEPIYASYMTSAEKETKDKLTVKYVVTAVDSDNIESTASESIEAHGNYYITGAKIRIKWSAVDGADYYKVYREVAGIYGFVGETEDCYLDDVGNNPDTTSTPPRYSNIFEKAIDGAITELNVVNGGSGYLYRTDGTLWYLPRKVTFKQILPYKLYSDDEQILNASSLSIDFILFSANSGQPIVTQRLNLKSNKTTDTISYYMDMSQHIPLTSSTLTVSNAYIKCSVTKVGDAELSVDWSVANDSQLSFKDNTLFEKLFSTGIKFDEFVGLFNQDLTDTVIEMPLIINDEKGIGANATVIAQGGVCQYAYINKNGYQYTVPTFSVIGNDVGSGAEFNCKISTSNNPDYPSSVTQYDQRRVFAGSYQNPLKVWFTTAGQQDLMTYHQPILDDDRIIIVAVNADADRIKHLVALDSLLLLTGSSELRVFTQNSDALTPSSVAVRAQSFVGANNVQPVIVNNSVVYCAQRGGHVRTLGYDYQQGGYSSIDISVRAPHLFDSKVIKSLSLSKAPVQVIWCVSSNGDLLGCTYLPEQSQVAWHRHSTRNGKFEDCCVISEGNEDHLYVVVNRNGVKTIERSDDFTTNKLPEFYRYMDSYLDAVFTSPQTTVTGLNHLENQEVAVYVDGVQQQNKIVTNGKIELDKAGNVVAVGLPIDCEFISVPLISNYEAELQGRTKNIAEVDLRCQYAGELYSANYNRGKHYLCKPTDPYSVNKEESYLVSVKVDGDWSEQSQFIVSHCDCLPIEIQSIVLTMTFEDGK